MRSVAFEYKMWWQLNIGNGKRICIGKRCWMTRLAIQHLFPIQILLVFPRFKLLPHFIFQCYRPQTWQLYWFLSALSISGIHRSQVTWPLASNGLFFCASISPGRLRFCEHKTLSYVLIGCHLAGHMVYIFWPEIVTKYYSPRLVQGDWDQRTPCQGRYFPDTIWNFCSQASFAVPLARWCLQYSHFSPLQFSSYSKFPCIRQATLRRAD